jgi:opacity protein-like surface antigen
MCDTPRREMPRDRCIFYLVRLFLRFFRPPLAAIPTVILCLVQVISLRGQERVRTAAGQLEIESFRNPEAFFRIGPTEEVLIGSVGVGYTDNANLTPTNKVSNLSFNQSLTLNATWVLSHLNQLNFNLAGQVTENFYGNGTRQLDFSIAPGSLLQFQFVVSDVHVRLYDHFANVQNPTTDPTATDTANLNDFTNTVGAVVDTDLNLAVLSLFVDYTYNNQSGTNVAGQSNPDTTGIRNSYRVGSSVSFNWTPAISYGIETTATQSNGSHTANVDSVNVGPFVRGKLTPLTDFSLAGGVSLYSTIGPIPPTTYYFNGVIRHQLSRNLQLILSALHDLVFTTSTNLVEETVFRVGTQLNLTRFFTLTAGPFVDIGNEKTGSTPGRFTQFGVGAGVGWKPHKRWSADLSYNFLRLESDIASNNYIQNSLALSLNYAF